MWRSYNDTLDLIVALTFYLKAFVVHFADYTVLHSGVVHGILRNMLMQPASQITLSQFRISQITHSLQ